MQTPKQTQIPRGIRNNNPLNIRIGNVWLGEVAEPTDPDFEQFVNMLYGVRAGFVLIRRYIKHYHRNTVRSIIQAWAPPSENNTEAYVAKVSSLVGIDADAPIVYEDSHMVCRLIAAMIMWECGQPVDMKIIEKAYTMA